ncbi:cysteine proteinases superfamily protein [Actinidia rufa]|uniref:Cysteine proteinases superfamily protein n=1 Tax=Actinidia rufa TaxID=165716 RepID=A0A7J0E0B9_9ERIC|nr:cysteine proteinases superfamily protein [Actinidia rufa]
MGAQKSQLFPLVIFLVWASLTSLISSSLPSEFSIVGRPGESVAEERVVELFKKWKEKHGKVYKHGQEAEKKFQNFRNNFRYVMEKNSERGARGGHLVGLTKFADMSNEEFREVYLSKVKKPTSKRMAIERRRQGKAASVAACEGPTSLDWRKYGIVTGVKDQGDCALAARHCRSQLAVHAHRSSTQPLADLQSRSLITVQAAGRRPTLPFAVHAQIHPQSTRSHKPQLISLSLKTQFGLSLQ